MRKALAWVTSLCLASSLFGMPAMSFAEEDGASRQTADETNQEGTAPAAEEGGLQGLQPIDAAALGADIPVINEGDSTTIEVPDGTGMTGGVVAPADNAAAPTDASLYVHFQSYAPAAAVSGLGLTLEGPDGTAGPFGFQAKAVEGTDDGQQAGDATQNPGGAQEYFARVSNLAPGSYTVRCGGASAFAPYEQAIELQASSCAEIALIDSVASPDVSGSSRGVMLYGDFDGSGTIDRDDAHAIVSAFDQQSSAMDLFGSGSVGLEDVQYFATFFLPGEGDDVNAASRVVQKVDPTHMLVSAESTSLDNVDVTGDLGSLLVNDGQSVTLAPSKDANGEDVAISTENPIRLIFETNNAPMEGLTLRSPVDSEGMPRSGIVLVEQTDGQSIEIPFGEDYVPPEPEEAPDAEGDQAEANAAGEGQADDALSELLGIEEAYAASGKRDAEVDVDNGLIVVDFGTRIAIKKITIRITATSSNKLAEIAQVEFLNDMEERIAPPDLNIPRSLSAVPGKKQFRVNWSAETNVTGYEVKVEQGGKSATFSTVLPTLEVSQFNGGKLQNETEYRVSVRSVNGDWRSPWSESIGVTPKATSVPARPTGVVATGGYGEVSLRWNSAEDAQSYVVYYRKAGTSDGYTQLTTTATSMQLTPLDLNTAFQGYIVAVNDLGNSPASATWNASTTGAASVKVPYYNLINRTAQTGKIDDSHITDVVCGEYRNGQLVRDYNDYEKSPSFEPRQVVDGNYDTFYYCKNRSSYPEGPTVTFDQAYEIRNIAVTTNLGTGYANGILEFRVIVTDENGKVTQHDTKSFAAAGSAAPNTVMVTLPEPTMAKSVQVGFMKYNYDDHATISELAFYKADRIQYDLDALWQEGQPLTALKDDVTQDVLTDLAQRIEWRDPDSATEANPQGEQHPNYRLLKQEIEYAQDIFDHKDALTNTVYVNPGIDPATNGYVGGLSGLQPLGVVASQDDELSIYVGRDGMSVGSNTALRLIIAPYGAPASSVTKQVVATLKAGVNQVKIDLTGVPSTVSGERGGSLYVQYISSNKGQSYTVRTFGGRVIPMLDLYGVTDKAERLKRCEAYIEHLEGHVAKLQEMHDADEHKNGAGDAAEYQLRGCVDNATEIGTDNFLFSLPAERILTGIRGGEGTLAEKLERRLASDEDMMELFYQHKGFDTTGTMGSADTAVYGAKNGAPAGRQNVRYMDMSGGVFMYAAGNHVGIQYNEGANPVGIDGPVYDEATGLGTSGQYLGWGLRHELGHEINQGCYTYAETTNNYYSQLGGAVNETDEGLRWGDYQKVYDRVTSGLKGAASGGTGIAMYWQLHLAYDDGYNYKTYDSYDQQMANLVFARIDAYARNPQAAPKAAQNGFTFTLAGADKDNALMRLACAATQKNLLSFFEAWGLTPDGTTLAYAQQWPVEERAIQYISDAVRKDGRLSNMGSVADKVAVKGEGSYKLGTSAVTVNLSNDPKDGIIEAFTGSNQGRFLGYEVSRNGVPVGFVKAGEDGTAQFTDTIATINNRAFTYTVRGVDKLLNYTEPVTVTFDGNSQVKVSHDGNIDKSGWSVSGNAYEESEDQSTTEEMPCEPAESTAADKMIDGDASTVFNGTKQAGASGNAQMTVNFGGTYAVCAVKFANGYDDLRGYTLETSLDGSHWTTVNKGESVTEGGVTKVFFGNPADASDIQMHTVDAGYLRLTAPDADVSIAELDVLGPTGDNVEFLFNQGADGNDLAVGRLKSDYVVSEADGEVVPADSTVIIGSFKGNAAYNAVKLYDQNGKLLPGAFLFFQDVAPNANIGETADGRWVYFITPAMREEVGWVRPTAVRAELYRVDDALTLEGERLVADTMWATVPEVLTGIEIKSNVSGTPAE